MLRDEELTAANREAALAVRPKPGQERFVSSVQESLAQAEAYGGGWARVLLDDGEVVGFVMGGFGDEEPFRSGVWKLLIGADHQGKGYGRTAVEIVADEARRRGHQSLGVFFHPGPDGPEGFWLRCGFAKSGKFEGGQEVHAERAL